jgi:hypothetical protein
MCSFLHAERPLRSSQVSTSTLELLGRWQVALEQGLLNQTDFDRNLRYRLTNIVANPIIVEKKLRPPLVRYWSDFVQLCARCKVDISSHPEKS